MLLAAVSSCCHAIGEYGELDKVLEDVPAVSQDDDHSALFEPPFGIIPLHRISVSLYQTPTYPDAYPMVP